jgi:uncharacterized protein
MSDLLPKPFTAFDGCRRIASGGLQKVALIVKRAIESESSNGPILIFDDITGRSIDIDIRGSDKEVVARLCRSSLSAGEAVPPPSGSAVAPRSSLSIGKEHPTGEPAGRGRPKLGVVAREITLLPRHWDWLNVQPGGASVALRKLVEEARRVSGGKDRTRQAQEAAFHFMSAMAGDMPGFEDALRALFANDQQRFNDLVAAWPDDVRSHATKLAFSSCDKSGS